MNLEQIQKERRIALANLPEEAFLEPFLSESIRIAYEAGMEVYYRPAETISLSKYERARQEGYEAGLERAKEMVRTEAIADKEWLLSALDDEIKKNEA